MENAVSLSLLLVAGSIATFAVYFVIVPTFTFLLCVRKKSGKWYIKKGTVLGFLLFFSKCDVPKNICYLYADAVLGMLLATVTLFAFFLSLFFFCGMVYVIYAAVILNQKLTLVLLLIAGLVAIIIWRIRVYIKTKTWQIQKEKIKSQINKFFQVFRKMKQKVSNKVCIKFENV